MRDGSASAPFTNLKEALENPRLRDGHTIYLLAGVHRLTADIAMRAVGITVRPYQNEAVVIDLQQADLLFNAPGLTLRDVTILSSETVRDVSTSDGMGQRMGAVDVSAAASLINVRFSAIANLGWWTGSTGTWRGVLVQDNGWDGPTAGYGHALYTQNSADDGRKTLDSCILINGYNYSLHAYGSSQSKLESYSIVRCIIMNERALIGGSSGASIDGVEIDDCVFYAPLQLGYSAASHRTATLTNSVLRRLQIQRAWEDLTVSGCTVLADNADCLTVILGNDLATLHVDNNVYISSKTRPFALDGEGWFTLVEWRARTGLDANSRHYATVQDAVTAGDLVLPLVRVFPVNEGRHIANIAIWNPLQAATVSVDLSALGMANGSYELRQVRDYTGDVRAVTYTGAAVDVAMSGTTAYPPGYPTPYHPEAVPANALPVFGAFELWAV